MELLNDEVGPNGIIVNPDKDFNTEAEWKYLEGILEHKTDVETAEKTKIAHKKLPELFHHIKTDSKITYPFKYDNHSGIFLYPELEENLWKNVTHRNGKGRASGFCHTSHGSTSKDLFRHFCD